MFCVRNQWLRRPPAKRLNYRSLHIASPFQPAISTLLPPAVRFPPPPTSFLRPLSAPTTPAAAQTDALLSAVCPAPFLPTPQHIDALKREESNARKQEVSTAHCLILFSSLSLPPINSIECLSLILQCMLCVCVLCGMTWLRPKHPKPFCHHSLYPPLPLTPNRLGLCAHFSAESVNACNSHASLHPNHCLLWL
jgi:hypothetical protein